MYKIHNLHAEVAKFKQWTPPYEGSSGEWECEYEHWDDFWAAAESAIGEFENRVISCDTAADLLYAIARKTKLSIYGNGLS